MGIGRAVLILLRTLFISKARLAAENLALPDTPITYPQ